MDAQPGVQPHRLPVLLSAGALALLAAAGTAPAAAQQAAAPAPDRDSAGALPVDGRDTVPRLAVMDREELARRLRRILDDPSLERAHAGLVVQVAETGEVLFDRASEKRFTAASTVKLVTSAVGLERLGPGFRWTTRLVAGGPVVDGTLRGDLWVVGGGDPGLGPDDLARWAGALREAGVRRVRGDVVGDGRSLPPPRWGRGWMWDELHLGWATGVTGLQLDESGVRGWLRPGARMGDTASVGLDEPDAELPVEVAVRTGPPGSRTRLAYRPREDAPGAPRIEGWVAADADSVRLWLASSHPTGHLLAELRTVLRDSSVTVDGRFRRPRPGERAPEAAAADSVPDPGRRPLAEGGALVFRSDSLGALLGDLLRPSDNQAAETLLRTLGREEGREATAREGLAVVRETVAEWGIDPDAVALADGSGLSRYDELAPAALVRVLRAVWQSPHHATFTSALAAPGRQGTLEGRLAGTPARGDGLRAKTGSLSSVRGLAGYVEAGGGETLVFALLLDGYAVPGSVAEGLRDLLVEQLALFRRPVVPGWPGFRSP